MATVGAIWYIKEKDLKSYGFQALRRQLEDDECKDIYIGISKCGQYWYAGSGKIPIYRLGEVLDHGCNIKDVFRNHWELTRIALTGGKLGVPTEGINPLVKPEPYIPVLNKLRFDLE